MDLNEFEFSHRDIGNGESLAVIPLTYGRARIIRYDQMGAVSQAF